MKNSELATNNGELECRLAGLAAFRRKNEGVTEQLRLILNELSEDVADDGRSRRR